MVDPQHVRHFTQLLEPMAELPKTLLKEVHDDIHLELDPQQHKVEDANATAQTQSKFKIAAKRMVNVGSMLGGKRAAQTAMTLRSHLEDTLRANAGETVAFSAVQRSILTSVFHAYAGRVCANGRGDSLRRSSWFRLLHHMGLLGCSGGVNFNQAGAVFNVFAETDCHVRNPNSLEQPCMSFPAFINALQHLLRGPNFFSDNAKLHAALFGEYLVHVEEYMGIKLCTPTPSANPGVQPESQRTEESSSATSEVKETVYNKCCSKRFAASAAGVLACQAFLAEEQMCEPEVLIALHEFEEPLHHLFTHYIGTDAFDRGAAEGVGDKDSAVASVSPSAFKKMLCDLSMFPEMVQMHSLKQHVRFTLKRHGGSRLSYPGFLEVLCRIFFVYLGVYGNPTQQRSSSKCKIFWLLTLLRRRCAGYGSKAGLPAGLVASPSGEENKDAGWLWQRRGTFKLDGTSLSDLVLWRVFDADCTPIPQFPAGCSPPLKSTQGAEVSAIEEFVESLADQEGH